MRTRNRILLIAVLLAAAVHAVRADTLAWWRMEGRSGVSADGQAVKSETNSPAMDGRGRQESPRSMEYCSDIPGDFIYDPVSGTCFTNFSSLMVRDNGTNSCYVQIPCDPAANSPAGFTIELFLKASGEQRAKGGDILPIFKKTRKDDKAAAFEIHISRPETPHSYNWLQASITPPLQQPQELFENKYGGITHVTDGKAWRHLALVYDASNDVVRYYCDYELLATTPVPLPLAPLDAAPFLIGGQPGGRGISGAIDEVRISRQPLEPSDFLRASARPLKNVSFKPGDNPVLPEDSGYVDIKMRYGAAGDGVTDDTKAIKKAFKECADSAPPIRKILYFPAGTYLVSDSCEWSRYLTVQGEGTNRTIIKLKDRCLSFGNPKSPKAVLIASDWNGGEGSGSSVENYISDLTIDTGRWNLHAIGLQFHANNRGGIENVLIRSGDGSGEAGLDFSRPWPGPCLQKNIRIEGFDTGIKAVHHEYNLVFENVELFHQNEAGIRNEGNCLSIRKLASSNSVPAIINSQAGGLVVLLDAELGGGNPENCAIENKGGLYARNVKTSGYKGAIRTNGKVVDGAEVKEYVAGKFQMMFDSPKSSLNLPVEDTPAPPMEPPSAWLNVAHFADKVKDGDWSDAIQAAIDFGKTTLYFPANTRCEIGKTIFLRGNVRRIVGLNSGIYGNPDTFKDVPMVSISGSSKATIVLEHISIGADSGKKVFSIEHNGPQTLVLKHCDISGYRTGPGVGPLFIEDMWAGPWSFSNGQKVWARQLSARTRHSETCIVNNGADLWIMGLKTAYESVNIVNAGGAKTEVLGGLVYPTRDVPDDTPMFENRNALFSVIVNESCYCRNNNIIVKDTQGDKTRDFEIKEADWSGGRIKIFYISNPLTIRKIVPVSLPPE